MHITTSNIGRTTIVFLYALLLWGIGTHIQAAHPDTVGGEPATHAPMTTKEERVEMRTERIEERKVLLEQRIKDRIVNLSSNVIARLTAGTDRMENIIIRIGTRISKLEGMGMNIEAAEEKLEEAKDALAEAREVLETSSSVQEALNGDSPREGIKAIRAQFMMVRDLLRQTHALLRETIALLKEGVRANETGTGVSDAVQNENAKNGTSTDEGAKTTE